MKADREEQTEFAIWIQKERKIVTFRETESFEKQVFQSQEEKLAYIYALCESGYRIL